MTEPLLGHEKIAGVYARHSNRDGELVLTPNCLFWKVKWLNFPRRVRSFHALLADIDHVSPGRGNQSLELHTLDGTTMDFLIYGIPLDTSVINREVRDAWVEKIQTSVSGASRELSPACSAMDARIAENMPNTQSRVFRAWLPVSLAIVAVATAAGLPWIHVVNAFFFTLCGLFIALMLTKSE